MSRRLLERDGLPLNKLSWLGSVPLNTVLPSQVCLVCADAQKVAFHWWDYRIKSGD